MTKQHRAATRRIELLAAARAVVSLYTEELRGVPQASRLDAYVRLERAIAEYDRVPVPDKMLDDTLSMAAEDAATDAECDRAPIKRRGTSIGE